MSDEVTLHDITLSGVAVSAFLSALSVALRTGDQPPPLREALDLLSRVEAEVARFSEQHPEHSNLTPEQARELELLRDAFQDAYRTATWTVPGRPSQ